MDGGGGKAAPRARDGGEAAAARAADGGEAAAVRARTPAGRRPHELRTAARQRLRELGTAAARAGDGGEARPRVWPGDGVDAGEAWPAAESAGRQRHVVPAC